MKSISQIGYNHGKAFVCASVTIRKFIHIDISSRLHYIPISQSYDEIYNIYAFFSGPTPSMLAAANATEVSPPKRLDDGQARLRRIARAGKQWKKTIGRPVDMEGKPDICILIAWTFINNILGLAYVYRLALEWARLWADDREAMTLRLDRNIRRDPS